MQLAIELPDELVFDIQSILKQQDIKQFAQDAIKSKFLQEQEAQQQKELMAHIRAIKPVKAPLSSEDMVRLLREGKDHEISKIREAKKRHTRKTQKLIGVLKSTDNFVMEEDNTQELLELLTQIKPVKCQYTTEQIVRSLRDGTELE